LRHPQAATPAWGKRAGVGPSPPTPTPRSGRGGSAGAPGRHGVVEYETWEASATWLPFVIFERRSGHLPHRAGAAPETPCPADFLTHSRAACSSSTALWAPRCTPPN